MPELELLMRMGVALAIGLLIGLEREWRHRGDPGDRAGVRTFALVGTAGALAGVMAGTVGPWLVPATVLGVTILFYAGQRRPASGPIDDITTAIAALATVLLGVCAVLVDMSLAVAAAIAITVLLALKPTLNRWIAALSREEVYALLRFLVIALVVLPVLPDKGYGPYEALNPFKIWFVVVAICAVTFAGYVAVRLAGAKRGQLLVGMLGGLVSSTAVTASGAAQSREHDEVSATLAAATIAACTVMAVRVVVIGTLLSTPLFHVLVGPLAAVTMVGIVAAFLLVRRGKHGADAVAATQRNPFELSFALRFAFIIAVLTLLSHYLQAQWGSGAIYLVAAAGGIADVDAVLAAAATGLGSDQSNAPWGLALLLAVGVNTLIKIGIAVATGTRTYGLWVGVGLGAMIVAGTAVTFLLPPLT